MTLFVTIDENGIFAPTYSTVLEDLKDKYRTIYGQDVYLEADSQDGQLLAVLALSIQDANEMAVSVYNSFSPGTAIGAGLSSVVKINGLRRKIASYSTVPVSIVGVVGTIILNGAVSDQLSNVWLLPFQVIIPLSGEITVTATAVSAGAIFIQAGMLDHIQTSTPGWQTVINTTSSSPGLPVEIDADLRVRQSQSTSIAATSPAAAILAGILNLEGVVRAKVYVNSSDLTDEHGIPAHSISCVVEGGDIAQIAQVICYTKSPGTGTYGDISVIVTDPVGIPDTINFFALDERPIWLQVTLQPFAGYLISTRSLVQATLVQYLEDLAIGDDVYHNRLFSPANLQGEAAIKAYQTVTGIAVDAATAQASLNRLSATYNVGSILLSRDNVIWGTSDLQVEFNAAASGHLINISVTE